MRRVIWRGVRANLGRFLLTLLAVTLGVAFLSGTLALRGVLSSSFEATLGSFNTYPLYVRGEKHAPLTDDTAPSYGAVDIDVARKARDVEGVKRADPVYTTSAAVLGPDDKPLEVVGSQLVLLGYSPGANAWPKIASGKAPAGERDVVIEESAAERLGLSVGDKVSLVEGSKLTPFTVTGTVRFATPVSLVSVGMVTSDTARHLLGDPKQVGQVGITLEPGHKAETVAKDLRAALGSSVSVDTQRTLIDQANMTVNKALGFINTFLLVFVAIAFFVGIFIITNTFRMTVRAEQKHFATLRAIGASAKQVFAVVALQGLIVGLAGSLLGIVVGQGLIVGLAEMLKHSFGVVLGGGLRLGPSIILTSIIVGLLVTFLGAVLPAREAALTPPVEAMRATDSREKPLKLRGIVGGLIAFAGIIALVVTMMDSEPSGALLGLGAALVLAGVLTLGPVLARPLMWVLSLPFRLVRPLGRLAYRNALANPRRSAVTAAALTVGVTLVTAGSVVAATVQASTADVVDSELHADLLVSSISSEGIPGDVADKVASVAGVKDVGRGFRAAYTGVRIGEEKPGPAEVGSLPKNWRDYIDLEVKKGTIEDFTNHPDTSVLVSESTAKAKDLRIGDKVMIAGAGGEKDYTVRAFVASTIQPASYLLDEKTLEALDVPGAVPLTLLVVTDKSHTTASVKKAVEEELDELKLYQVLDRNQFKSQLADQVQMVLGILYALLGLSIVIAVLGIVNTLSLSISERIREIGLLRAVGMSRRNVGFMIVIESILISVFGTLLGLLVGTFLAAALCNYLANEGLETMVIPWGTLAVLGVAAVIVGAIAAVAPAVKAVRYKLLDAVART